MQAQIDVQKMIFTALNGNVSAPVYDDVPQEITRDDSGFPFIVIGEDTFSERSSDLKSGFDATITVHVWSRYAGTKEIKSLQGEIYAALHRQPLNTDNDDYGVAGVTFEFSDSLLDPDGLTRHGVMRFNLYLAETII